eukprot:Gb_21373 [translate_table: standard]
MNNNQLTEKALRNVFETTSYITLGTKEDPFEYGKKQEVRSSERGKQFMTNPGKIGKSPDVLFEKAWPWVADGDAFVDQSRYVDKQPERFKGFLDSDFSKRDEFSNTFRTEQYREHLKNETKHAKKMMLAKAEQMAKLKEKYDLAAPRQTRYAGPKYLYDIGKTAVTEHCMKCHKETFYCPHRIAYGTSNPTLEKDTGNLKTMSEEVGSTAKQFNYSKSEYARKPIVQDTFFRKQNVNFPNKTNTNFVNQGSMS